MSRLRKTELNKRFLEANVAI